MCDNGEHCPAAGARASRPALVLLDPCCAGAERLEVARRLRQDPRTPRCRSIRGLRAWPARRSGDLRCTRGSIPCGTPFTADELARLDWATPPSRRMTVGAALDPPRPRHPRRRRPRPNTPPSCGLLEGGGLRGLDRGDGRGGPSRPSRWRPTSISWCSTLMRPHERLRGHRALRLAGRPVRPADHLFLSALLQRLGLGVLGPARCGLTTT